MSGDLFGDWLGAPELANVVFDLGETNAADGRGDSGETLVDHMLRNADGVEEMSAAIAVDDADAHLRHDLGEAKFERVEQVFFAMLGIEIARGFKREPRTDGADAKTEQDGDVMDFAAVGGIRRRCRLRRVRRPW